MMVQMNNKGIWELVWYDIPNDTARCGICGKLFRAEDCIDIELNRIIYKYCPYVEI